MAGYEGLDWNEYYKQELKKFRETHESIQCSECGRWIEPGLEILVDNDKIFCCGTCYVISRGVMMLEFLKDDLAYEKYFPKKLEHENSL